VKNVLAQVAINLELISSNPSMRRFSNTQRDRLEQLVSEVDKSIANIQEFLDLASESVNETALYKISTLVNHSIRLLEVKIEKYGINVDTSKMNDNIYVKVNPTQMIMAFLNLIDNAIDALKEVNRTRYLNIFTRNDDISPWLEVGFDDNGCGISHENLDKIFEPFFSTKSKKGRGIGLLGSRRIIEVHYGKLPKPVSQLGKGTRFIVYLPRKLN
jgi:signal transduction histidine kinase